jgi:hypothetical protein
MLKKISLGCAVLSSVISSFLFSVDTLLDTQYVIIELIDSYEIILSSNFSYIKAYLDRNTKDPKYLGDCTNTLTITAASPVLLEVSLGNHTLSNLDQLQLDITAPQNGLSRSVKLWDGAAGALNEQLAQGVEGEQIDFRLKISYSGDLKTAHDQKGAWLFFTISADSENFE